MRRSDQNLTNAFVSWCFPKTEGSRTVASSQTAIMSHLRVADILCLSWWPLLLLCQLQLDVPISIAV